jgi:hypothetical protein
MTAHHHLIPPSSHCRARILPNQWPALRLSALQKKEPWEALEFECLTSSLPTNLRLTLLFLSFFASFPSSIS